MKSQKVFLTFLLTLGAAVFFQSCGSVKTPTSANNSNPTATSTVNSTSSTTATTTATVSVTTTVSATGSSTSVATGSATTTYTATSSTPASSTPTATLTPTGAEHFSFNGGTVSSGSVTIVFGLSPQTVGMQFWTVVELLDSNNNIVTSYNGTMHFTTTDKFGTIPADFNATNGVGTFFCAFDTSGTQKVTVVDKNNSSLTGSFTAQVTPGPAWKMNSAIPSSTLSGSTMTIPVAVVDFYGNTVTSNTDTIHFSTADGASTTPPDTALVNGAGLFNVTLRTPGYQYLVITDKNTNYSNSGGVQVSGGMAGYSVLQESGNYDVAGSNFKVTVSTVDAGGNYVGFYNGTADLTSSDPQAAMPSSLTFVNGAANFNLDFKTVGFQSVTVTDASTSSLTGNVGVTVTAAATSQLLLTPSSSTTSAGANFGLTVTAMDAYNNPTPYFNDKLHITSTDPSATLPADFSMPYNNYFFVLKLNTVGTQTITLTDTQNSSIIGTTGAITVTP